MTAQPIDETPAPTPRRDGRRGRYSAAPLPHVAAIYTRVSTKPQAGEDKTSPQTQEAGCCKLASADGFPPVAADCVFSDVHSGEDYYERPGLMRLLNAARAKRFARLYVNSTDRLARDPIDLGWVFKELARYGVEVYSVTEPNNISEESRTELGKYAKMENAWRRERTMRGRNARALKGKPIPGPRPPYGFRWIDERDREGRRLRLRWEHDPDNGPVVASIWRQALTTSTWTVRGVAARLTREGVSTPTGRPCPPNQWDPTTVRKILTDPRYWGRPRALTHERVAVAPYERAHYAHRTRTVRRTEGVIDLPADLAPPFVTPEQAAEVHRRMGVHQRLAPRGSTHTEDCLLAHGIARCGYCARALRVDASAAPALRYRCRKHVMRAGGCSAHSIVVPKLDGAAWEAAAAFLCDPRRIDAASSMTWQPCASKMPRAKRRAQLCWLTWTSAWTGTPSPLPTCAATRSG